MGKRHILLLTVVLFAIGVPFSTAQGTADGWVTVGDGIDYQEFRYTGVDFPIYVTRMDRSNPNVFIESSVSPGVFNGSGWETVRQMSSRYDEAINYWGKKWGGRNHVVAAINGDFYIEATGLPEKGIVHSGWYDKRIPDYNGWSGFAWMMDRDAFIGECVIHPKDRQYVTFLKDNSTMAVSQINAPRKTGDLIVYTPGYGSRTPQTGDTGIEVVVEMAQPSGILPSPAKATGKIIAIQRGNGATPIPFDAVVISSSGDTGITLGDRVRVGDSIGITQEVGSWDAKDCKTNLGSKKDWTNAYASIGGSYAFLQNGVIDGHDDNPGATEGAPRTAIALNDRYIFFFVNEGTEGPGNDRGMSYAQLGGFARDILGATWGIAEDGGGSSTLVVNGNIVNHLSDCKDGNTDVDECERAIVNGLMMVIQQPMIKITGYVDGDETRTRIATALRLGPGTNYGSVMSLPTRTTLTVVPDSHGLNGVLAKGTNWWKVATSGGQVGWVSQVALSGQEIMLPMIVR